MSRLGNYLSDIPGLPGNAALGFRHGRLRGAPEFVQLVGRN